MKKGFNSKKRSVHKITANDIPKQPLVSHYYIYYLTYLIFHILVIHILYRQKHEDGRFQVKKS